MKKLIVALFVFLIAAPAFAAGKKDESTWERVMKTRTLRCAYTVYPTFVDRDPNTGALSGIAYDVVNEIGKLLDIKIEWTIEVSPDAAFEGIGQRFDANCTGYAVAPARTWGGDFTQPFMFLPYVVYIRADETRFKTLKDFNDPSIKIATLDGEYSQIVAKENFPKAEELTYPSLTSTADRLEAVATGKADMVPMDATVGAAYLDQRPGRLKAFPEMLLVGGGAIVIPHDEYPLMRMLDSTIDTMIWNGSLERILKSHQKYEGTLMAPTGGYEAIE